MLFSEKYQKELETAANILLLQGVAPGNESARFLCK